MKLSYLKPRGGVSSALLGRGAYRRRQAIGASRGPPGSRSSIGESDGLLIRRLQVRFLPGAPLFGGARAYLRLSLNRPLGGLARVKKFKKGDTVIYPQHGACTVKAIKRMRAFEVMQDYLILESVMTDATGKGMTLSVPVAKVYDLGIRPPVSKSELQDLVDVLSKPDPRVPANWSRRFKNHQEKLKSGDVYQVAEVVRNLAARDRENQLSAAEKTMYERARLNLISEIAPSKRCSTEEATRFLDDALEKGVLSAGGKSQLQELGRASTGGKRKTETKKPDAKKVDAKKPVKPKATSKKK